MTKHKKIDREMELLRIKTQTYENIHRVCHPDPASEPVGLGLNATEFEKAEYEQIRQDYYVLQSHTKHSNDNDGI
ncbi:MAG: hypothetical protein WC533_05035 [Candidatus Pacearchaeota archaeon]